MARGGKRPGAGRKRIHAEAAPAPTRDFATRVLKRVGKKGWLDYVDLNNVKSDEDLALHYLAGNHGEDQFNRLLDRKYGKAVQPLQHKGQSENDGPIKFELRIMGAKPKSEDKKK